MSEDECDFQLGDVGNRSLTFVGEWVISSEVFTLISNGSFSTSEWAFVSLADSLSIPASCFFFPGNSPHTRSHSFILQLSSSCPSSALIGLFVLLMRYFMSCIILAPPTTLAKFIIQQDHSNDLHRVTYSAGGAPHSTHEATVLQLEQAAEKQKHV